MGYDSWAKEVVARLAERHGSVLEVAVRQLADNMATLGAKKLTDGQRKQLAAKLLDSLTEGRSRGAR